MPLLLEGDIERREALHRPAARHRRQRCRTRGTRPGQACCAGVGAQNYRLPGGALPLSTPAMLRQRAGGRSPAAEAVLCAMVESTQVDFDNALRIESRYFCQTAINPVHRKGSFSL
jgi:3-hydroxyacyl-CoA dehydrogenase/enoyl-CoA hydratase/3-hydroxybutyryl-CoA epimerase